MFGPTRIRTRLESPCIYYLALFLPSVLHYIGPFGLLPKKKKSLFWGTYSSHLAQKSSFGGKNQPWSQNISFHTSVILTVRCSNHEGKKFDQFLAFVLVIYYPIPTNINLGATDILKREPVCLFVHPSVHRSVLLSISLFGTLSLGYGWVGYQVSRFFKAI